MPSHGEAWCIPAFEAMLFGNTPICSNDGGPKDFIDPKNKDTGWLVDGVYDVCQDSNAAFDFTHGQKGRVAEATGARRSTPGVPDALDDC